MWVDAVVMYFYSMLGPLFPAFNTEVMLLYQLMTGTQHPVVMAVTASAGQATLYLVLYTLGEGTLMRWKALGRRLAALTPAQRERFRQGTSAALASGALTGLPPVILMAPLVSSFGYSRLRLVVIVFTGRVVRFGLLLAFSDQVRRWFGI